MLGTLFGDVTEGKLARLPFLGYWILLAAIFVGIGVAVGAAEQMVGGDLQSAQAGLRDTLGVPALILISVILAVILFVRANLKAKRIRDIGLPGWWTLLGIVVVGIGVSLAVSHQAAQGFSSVVMLAPLLVPGNTFGGKSGPEV